MTTTFTVGKEGIRVLGKSGWRQPVQGECFETDDGNYVQVNAEGYWSGVVWGFAAGILASLVTLGIVAAAVSASMK